MEQDPVLFCVAKQQVVHQRRQRNSMPAGGHIPRAEIADRRYTRAFRHYSCHAQGKRGKKTALGFVPGRVSGTAEALYLLQAHARTVNNLACGCREGFAQQPVEKHRLFSIGFSRAAYFANEIAEVGRIRLMDGQKQTDPNLQAGTFRFQQHGIHAVHAGAGGEPDDAARDHHDQNVFEVVRW